MKSYAFASWLAGGRRQKKLKSKNQNNLGMFVKNMKCDTKVAGQIKCSYGSVY